MTWPRSIAALALFTTAIAAARPAAAQSADSAVVPPNYWGYLALGATASLAIHEAAHVLTAVAVGGDPTFGFAQMRPTIYSGINAQVEPHKQFLFSAAGLTAQNLIDEAILDVPHARGSPFERGILAGGIATTLFYLTIGRTGSVSDVEFMARTHAMTKRQIALLYGGLVSSHMWRMYRDPHYANFFARPTGNGGLAVGLELTAR